MNGTVLRRMVVALVMLALSLAGIGRGLAASGNGPASIVVDGFVIALCHTDDGSQPGDPQDGAHHDCCDQCTLCAAVDVPVIAAFTPPARIAYVVAFEAASPRLPALARARTPRLSQGPPAA